MIEKSRHDPEHFSQIFNRYFSQIHGYVASRLGSANADDIAAEAFLIGFTGRHRYDLSWPSARPWLYGIATNLIRQHRRSEIRRYRALARASPGDDFDEWVEQATERLSAQRMLPSLSAGLAQLSQADRDVLLLVAYEQLSYQEIALALRIPAGTVGSRLNRARRRLRQALQHSEPAKR
ncbi:RNA polymerase sigma factor [Nonomuraea turcica]|uniref:RNA polymerase sigma factor n=1 Tax=Nonomuraea sp. G32 TaxID=3067274 RepID=UPI00273B604B|nr:RNA polymerase sigma factor [Nonomuraea sp. G32]MDP4509349.1 RNA polymerase sigma factor [Nonomuraea sp. G32]